jgi:hypothetical protein
VYLEISGRQERNGGTYRKEIEEYTERKNRNI